MKLSMNKVASMMAIGIFSITTLAAKSTWAARYQRQDRIAPVLSITQAPGRNISTNFTSISFSIQDNSGSAQAFCSLDSQASKPCNSPLQLSGLSQGNHTVRIYAMDRARNRSATRSVFFSVSMVQQPPAPAPKPSATPAPTPSPTPNTPPVNNQDLYSALSDSIDKRIAGKPFASAAIYNSQNYTQGAYVRNPNNWAADIDLTCFSPWNSYNVHTTSATLISPVHVLMAKHVTIPNGAKIHFVTNDNQLVVRTMAASAGDPNSDISIGRLDSPVPSSIKFCKVMPSTTSLAAAGLTKFTGLPVLYLRQEENLYVRDVSNLGSNIGHVNSVDSQRKIFSKDLIGGDSGNPIFFILNNELALAATHMGYNSAPFAGNHISVINSLMNQLSGGYQLTEIPLK